MISFYPGPSRVHDELSEWTKSAHKKGILSMNHRSPEFIALSEKTIMLLRKKLSVPEKYTVLFASSATECWEIIAQSLIKKKSIHVHNGAFGEKWFDYTSKLKPGAQSVSFNIEKELRPKELIFGDGEIICLTQNETSNGTQVSNKIIAAIKKNNPGHLIAVDATSSMAGIVLDFASADLWFAVRSEVLRASCRTFSDDLLTTHDEAHGRNWRTIALQQPFTDERDDGQMADALYSERARDLSSQPLGKENG
ncbi:MAG: aminotransferase class V-fold PLP-dependent enzyme [Bacteroidota bacterium]